MNNVSFTGRKYFDNMHCLGDSMCQKTNVEEDIADLSKYNMSLSEAKNNKTVKSSMSLPCIQNDHIEVSFPGDTYSFGNVEKLYVKDKIHQTTTCFKKREFADKNYKHLFENLVEISKNVYEQGLKSIEQASKEKGFLLF